MTKNSDMSKAPLYHGKILTIQSHVVHGYVGNRVATFPLQYRGWDVDALNTVQYSNHLGYGSATGFKYGADDLCQVLQNGLIDALDIHYDAIITGYTPSEQALEQLSEVIARTNAKESHQLKWVVDPVLGDNGRLYVSEAVIPVYKSILRENKIFLATPNQFEMELLSGVTINDMTSLKTAMEAFHSLYPLVEKIVVTSVKFSPSSNYIVAASDKKATPNGNAIVYFEIPEIKCHFSGSGDLLTALLLDSLLKQKDNRNLEKALALALWLTGSILQRTYELAIKEHDIEPIGIPSIKDLKVIQCLDLLKLVEIPELPSSGYL
ncbi:putative pyridoxal kinase BUD17 [Nakaseomyces bracarensis]|uniref:pyridoxal kinase n=1 Tax=Nakaseomyces bracarensis TaxID=273131 RepID=A0ABR4NYT9_9SACH